MSNGNRFESLQMRIEYKPPCQEARCKRAPAIIDSRRLYIYLLYTLCNVSQIVSSLQQRHCIVLDHSCVFSCQVWMQQEEVGAEEA